MGQRTDGQWVAKCFHPTGEDWDWRQFAGALGMGDPEAFRSGRPVIEVAGRPAFEVARDGWDALVKASDAQASRLFYWGTEAVKLVVISDGRRSRLRLEPLSREVVAAAFDRSATWLVKGVGPAKLGATQEGRAVIGAALQAEPFPIPPLNAVVEVPLFVEDGRLLNDNGYDPGSGLFMHLPPELRGIEPMTDPEAALALVREMWSDFPFTDEASWANALAMLLTTFIKGLYPDMLTPLFVADAPTPRSGKSLIVRTVVAISSGRDASVSPLPIGRFSEVEAEKQMLSVMRSPTSYVFYDNIKGKVDSGARRHSPPTPTAAVSLAKRRVKSSNSVRTGTSQATVWHSGATWPVVWFRSSLLRILSIPKIGRDWPTPTWSLGVWKTERP